MTATSAGLPVLGPRTESMRARDGVRLDADVYRPDAPGPWPVLLMRQPYGRAIASTVCYAHPAWYAAQGYVVVIQDVRGRGTSEGVFGALENDRADGADAVAWAAELEGSSGAVGMYGFSYQGVTQLLAAAEAGPALRALAPAMIGWNLADDWAYENGAFNLAANLGWAVQIAAESARLGGDAAAFDELHAYSRSIAFSAPNPARPALMERHRALSHYHRWLEEPADSAYWRAISPGASAGALLARGLPMLFIGGWFDSHLPGTLAGYKAMAPGGQARLEVGPWTHFPWDRRVGGLDFGPDAIGAIDRLQVRWFDRWLKGVDNGVEREPPVSLFDMGARCWRRYSRWPDAPRRFHLASDGRAAVDGEAGRLTDAAPSAPGVDHLVHDPWRPAPSVGGAFGAPSGPVDRAVIDARPDVLTFTTAPLGESLTLAGDASALLVIRCDAPSFDLACVLSRVVASGASFQLAEGYVSVPLGAPRDPVRVPLRATCATLAPGERLRLSIAGASFPAHPVNPGDGRRGEDAALIEARLITLGLVTGPGASHLIVSTPGEESVP